MSLAFRGLHGEVPDYNIDESKIDHEQHQIAEVCRHCLVNQKLGILKISTQVLRSDTYSGSLLWKVLLGYESR